MINPGDSRSKAAFERSATEGDITRAVRGKQKIVFGNLPTKQRSGYGGLPKYKRSVHLGVSTSDNDAWNRSLDHTLQYCRNTFSPKVWVKVRRTVSKVCKTTNENRAKTSRDMRLLPDISEESNSQKSRGNQNKEGQKFESMIIHR